MTSLRRLGEWAKARPMVVDGVLAALMLVLLAGAQLGEPVAREHDANLLSWLLVVTSTVPLAWRRIRPSLVMTVVGASAVIYEVIGFPETSVNAFAVLLALYAMAAYAPRRDAIIAGVITAIALVAVIAANYESEGGNPGDVVGNYIIFALPWVAGDSVRQRRERIAALEERAALAEQSKDEEASRAVSAERTRIARELHDVVAHSVSVMVVQAGAARRLLLREEPDPTRAIEALTSVETTGRESLNELRRLLGVLRKDDDRSFGRVPQPSIRYVSTLVDQSRDAGLDVSLVVEGKPASLSAGVDLTAYRIVQEALTNALKHAGPGAHADVHVCYADDVLEVIVTDDGRGADGDRSPGGHGLVGMEERVNLFGGELRVGNQPGGGFQVRASLPLGEAVRQ